LAGHLDKLQETTDMYFLRKTVVFGRCLIMYIKAS